MMEQFRQIEQQFKEPSPAPVRQRMTPKQVLKQFRQRRHLRIQKDNMPKVLTRNATYRLARRAGIKRCAQGVLLTAQTQLKDFLQAIIGDAVTVLEGAQRKIMTKQDVLYALNKNKKTLYSVQ